jgi:hypothetical protein
MTSSAARDNLLQAIIDFDRENNDRTPTEVLTHFVVIYTHTEIGDGGHDQSQVSHIFGPNGLPNWQILGLLDAAQAYLRHREVTGDGD